MWDMNEVISIEYRLDYTFFIKFDDGRCGTIDFEEYFERGPIFKALRQLPLFKQARIEGGTISWPNGVDIAPETLYAKLVQPG